MGRQQTAVLKTRIRGREAPVLEKKHQVKFSRSARAEAAISDLTVCCHSLTGEFISLTDLAPIAISYLEAEIPSNFADLIEQKPWQEGAANSFHAIWLTEASFLKSQSIVKEVLRRHRTRIYVRQVVVLALCVLADLEHENLSQLFRYIRK